MSIHNTVAPNTHSNKAHVELDPSPPTARAPEQQTNPEADQIKPLSSLNPLEYVLSSDSDKSYAYIHKRNAYIHTKMSPMLATIEHLVTKHCPILTGGETSPQILLLLKDAPTNFLLPKNIADKDCIKLILGTFKCIHDWIAMEREHLLTLTFDEFMAKLQQSFLPSDWVKTT